MFRTCGGDGLFCRERGHRSRGSKQGDRSDPLHLLCFGYLICLSEQNRMPQVAGSVISAVRDACRNGLLDWSPRLMLAMYTCDIQASSELLVH